MNRSRILVATALALAALVAIAAVVPVAAQDKKPERYIFTAFAVNMGSGPNAGVVDIALERLSTDEERANLITTFVEKGQDALLKLRRGLHGGRGPGDVDAHGLAGAGVPVSPGVHATPLAARAGRKQDLYHHRERVILSWH